MYVIWILIDVNANGVINYKLNFSRVVTYISGSHNLLLRVIFDLSIDGGVIVVLFLRFKIDLFYIFLCFSNVQL